jgi:hypothetical protein
VDHSIFVEVRSPARMARVVVAEERARVARVVRGGGGGEGGDGGGEGEGGKGGGGGGEVASGQWIN